MMKFSELHDSLNEDSQHSGYPITLETPRVLGKGDFDLVDKNKDRMPGDHLVTVLDKVMEQSYILQNNDMCFQYTHTDEDEIHIESVDLYRNIWNSIHIPKYSATFVGALSN